MLGVSWKGSEASAEEFVARHALTFPSIYDPNGAVFSRFGVLSQPAYAFTDGTGNVEVVPGAMNFGELDRAMARIAGR